MSQILYSTLTDDQPDELIINEIFGPTIQGEGPSRGQLATFVRLGVCNLRCTWCDTKYSWDFESYDHKEELERIHINKVAEMVRVCTRAICDSMVVITGGEPLLQQRKVVRLIARLPLIRHIEIETAGTVVPFAFKNNDRVFFNVSPKLPSSGNPLEKADNPEAIKWFLNHGNTIFKYVIADNFDFEHMLEHIRNYDIPNRLVWVQPEYTFLPDIMDANGEMLNSNTQHLINKSIHRGFNISLRDHITIWGSRRGV